MNRLAAALAACRRSRPWLDACLARLGLPPPERMDQRLLAVLVLIVESWGLP